MQGGGKRRKGKSFTAILCLTLRFKKENVNVMFVWPQAAASIRHCKLQQDKGVTLVKGKVNSKAGEGGAAHRHVRHVAASTLGDGFELGTDMRYRSAH